MPAKAPIYLKPNSGKYSTGNGKGGKKLRELLSAEMISLPLGDFRHMAHVGRGGADDMFGDTTFLKTKNSHETAAKDGSTESEGEVTQNMQRKAKTSKKQRNNSVPDSSQIKPEAKSLLNHSNHGYGPLDSPILQSAFSLPLLPQQSLSTPSSPDKDNKVKTTKNNNQIGRSKATSHETGLDNLTSTPNGVSNGPPKPRRIIVEDCAAGTEQSENPTKSNEPSETIPQTAKSTVTSLTDTTSIDEGWALELDLGTSLMDDVMGIMEKIEL